MIANVPEIIHIPVQYQQFKSSLDLPHAAAAIIRHSSSTNRTLGMSSTNCPTFAFFVSFYFMHHLFTCDVFCIVQSVTGQNYIELHAQNSNDRARNRQDTSLQSDSTSSWPV